MSSETEKKLCPACGSALRPSGVCPRCSVAALMAGLPDEEEEEQTPAGFGDYELLGEIASGGAGVVWRARQRSLGREVALKILRETCLPGEESARRFRFEGETVARLRHPHIVNVHEIGESGGRWFMSMELLTGGSLADRLREGPLPAALAAEWMAKIARAVQHAHDRGVLHRDLKPGNILLDERGEPKVGDFGLARGLDAEVEITVAGGYAGTPAYMSPEQVVRASRELTTASDVWALGAVLYEMLTGRLPFPGESHAAVFRQILEEEPATPGKTGNAAPPRDLVTLALRCLQKEPAGRPPSALYLAEELERWQRGEPILSRPATPLERLWKWARRHPARAALTLTSVAAVLAIAGISAAYSVRLGREREATLHRVARQQVQAGISAIRRGSGYQALLPLAEAIGIGCGDAEQDRMNRIRFAAIVRQGPSLAGLWQGPAGERMRAAFSADGKVVLLTHGRTARRTDGPALEHGAEIIAADLTADGARVVCGTADGRWTLWDALAATVIASGEGKLRPFPVSPACDPGGIYGGGRFVVVEKDSLVRLLSTATGEPDAPDKPQSSPVLWAALSPDGEKLAVFTAEGILLRVKAEAPAHVSTGARTGHPGAEMNRITNGTSAPFVSVLDAGAGFVSWADWPPGQETPPSLKACEGTAETMRAFGFHGATPEFIFLDAAGVGCSLNRGAETASMVMTMPQHARTVAASFGTGDEFAITLTSSGAAQRWQCGAASQRISWLWVSGPPLEARLNADSRRALLTTALPAVWLWQWDDSLGATSKLDAAQWAATSQDFPPTEARPGPPADEVRTADGRHLRATMIDAETLQLTDLAHPRTIPPLRHPLAVTRVRFSPDGRLLCTLHGQANARAASVWDTATGEPICQDFLLPEYDRVLWSADSQRLAAVRKEGRARVWDFSPDPRPVPELQNLARLLSSHRIVPGSDTGIIQLTAEELRAAREAAGPGPYKR